MTTKARGYGAAHQEARARWERRVLAGAVVCSRCLRPIAPTESWDLDHADDRGSYLGPSHSSCNRRAGAVARERATRHSRVW